VSTFTLPSDEVAVAMDPEEPSALTVYCAMNQLGRIELVRDVPRRVRRHVDRSVPCAARVVVDVTCTDSPADQLVPERTTCSPGE